MGDFSTIIYIGMGLIMVVGGRTFFESILQYPHNDSNWSRTLPYGCCFLLMEEISLQPCCLAFFVLQLLFVIT
jgi:hypothetical protein